MSNNTIYYGPFMPARVEEWAYWIMEREAMRRRRERHTERRAPYSRDPIMAGTRWCNVRRIDDKVSRWLLDNWYPDQGTALHWVATGQQYRILAAAMLARMVNRPETLSEVTGGNRFSAFKYEKVCEAMYRVKATGQPVFTNAYIINGASGGPKIEQVLNAVQKMKDDCLAGRQYLDPRSMCSTATALCALPGVGSFIAGQIVADLRWVLPRPNYWNDRMTWAPPGPGSSRGIKYLLGLATAADMTGRGRDLTEKQFLPPLRQLISLGERHPLVRGVHAERQLEAHDYQNTLCELGKYIRIKAGGHAKNRYV